jgi:predicted Zn-dependent protease
MKRLHFSLLKNRLFYLLVSIITLSTACMTVEDVKQKRTEEEQREALEKEIEVGRAVFAKLAGNFGVVKDEQTTSYLNMFGKSLGLYTERQELEYFFCILATEQVNAYSLPGGYILVSHGALARVQTPGQLAGILAHELGHVNERHILDAVTIETRFNFFEALARFLAGPRQIVTTVVSQISDKVEETLFVKGFASDDEYEADAYAVDLLQAIGISALDYIDYLDSLYNESGKPEMENLDKTHPGADTRIEKMQALLYKDLQEMKTTDDFTSFLEKINDIKVEEWKPKEEQ